MDAAGGQIGDQMILEEEYDPNYIPTEQEIRDYAREVGIDPDKEPELMWLAREGIVMPLPSEWKPCQDVTGEVYYFNFTSGQSTWDHPCDLQYRSLVASERDKLQAKGLGQKKEKKKKKEKKEKKEKREKEKREKEKELLRPPAPVMSALAPVQAPLGSLAPLRGLLDSSGSTLRGSVGSSGGLEPLRSSCGLPRSGLDSSLLGVRPEEKVSLSLLGFEEEEDRVSEGESPRGTARLLQNLHMDIGSLGAGFEYEDSESAGTPPQSAPPEEQTEPELQDLRASEDEEGDSLREGSLKANPCSVAGSQASTPDCLSDGVCPPTPDKTGPGSERSPPAGLEDRDTGSEVEEEEEAEGNPETGGPGEKESPLSKVAGEMSVDSGEVKERGPPQDRKKPSLSKAMWGARRSEGGPMDSILEETGESQEMRSEPDQEGEDSPEVSEQEKPDRGSVEMEGAGEGEGEKEETSSVSHSDCGESEELIIERGGGRSTSKEPGTVPLITQPEEDSEASEHIKELRVSLHSDEEESRKHKDPVFGSCISEQVLDVEALSPALQSPKSEEKDSVEDRKEESVKAQEEEERRKRAEAAERRKRQDEERKKQEKSTPDPLEEPKQQAKPGRGLEERQEEADRGGRLQRSYGERRPGVERGTARDSSQDSVEEQSQETERQLEAERGRALQERQERLRGLREEMGREEEEQARVLHQEKEHKLRALRETLREETEEEEEKLREEEKERLQRLRVQIRAETEEEERKLREEKESVLQDLRGSLEAARASESRELEAKRRELQDSLRKEVEEAVNEERRWLEAERERQLEQLRSTHEKQRKEELQALEKQHSQELQQLRETAQEKHSKVISSLQKQISEAQSSEEEQLQGDLLKAQQKIQQAAEYKRELSDLLRDKRQEVERDHERKLEALKEEQRAVLEQIREEQLEEERKQRARLLSTLQEERERLLGAHERELSELRAELEGRLQDTRHAHSQKEAKLQDLGDELELRARELKARSTQLQAQEEALRRRREQLQEEEEQAERHREKALAAAAAAAATVDSSRVEEHSLQDSIRQSRRELERLQGERESLETEVQGLQRQSQRLQRRVSELEAAVERKQGALRSLSLSNGVPPAEREEGELHIADLQGTEARLNKADTGSTEAVEKEEDISIDDVRHYISSEGVSLQKAWQFLERQSSSLCRRQAVLKAAKQQWRQDVLRAQAEQGQDPDSSLQLEDTNRTLQQEACHLDQMKSTMHKGSSLLRRKEERLSQLENSLLEELSDEDTLRGTAGKKMVTFDLSDSDDISSIDSTAPPPHTSSRNPALPLAPPRKVQFLSESLQRISSQLNSVLGVLGSLGQQQSPVFPSSQSVPLPPAPLSVYRSQSTGAAYPSPNPAASPLPTSWAWGSPLQPSHSVDHLLTEKWHKYFPGGAPDVSGAPTPPPSVSQLGYTPASEQIRRLRATQPSAPVADRHRIQGLIDSNKKWLQDFKKDPKTPLFTRTRNPPSIPGLVQLGLDENNQIKVYHY
ncbi:centrosomal protein of 164 kDa-like isoform X1 [Acipenser ruthenus]|uniref:centrosomal protein of 164 kDa-like isoform X1 n=1 Tax=Acipenser ruthenus TaxID=7906 RepID=UPI002741FC69|nr:centrosomal protein of 164 kDa-like isoform X1 [Acipenser ruthenus]XP_058865857.1 centrosomal protein of 164 kDa-like isoform X1 [Acipenser ruthenus]XP_058865858.1 centrosomal protein of 164 kDa-like isoform X1 [Acipenser ruthenus]